MAAPTDAVVDDYPIGTWLSNRRAQDRRGELSAGRGAALDALVEGESWHSPDWPVAWQRHPTHADEYLRERAERGGGGRPDDVGLDVVHRGTSMGRWVARQRSGWDGLNAAQREQLLALGLTQPAMVDTSAAGVAVAVADGPRPKRTREQAWAIAVGAAAAYRARVGHVEVPRAHVETVTAFDGWPEDVRLGVWVTTTGSRRAKRSRRSGSRSWTRSACAGRDVNGPGPRAVPGLFRVAPSRGTQHARRMVWTPRGAASHRAGRPAARGGGSSER
ncbi:helicase associated domain-containing protein [Embleya sp. NPDC059237]|uniref:helicase associated domain-containing protein n=1 Tax=Embleya sp. NPDC059237 TaxID=3346784 RepID=UPI003696C16A